MTSKKADKVNYLRENETASYFIYSINWLSKVDENPLIYDQVSLTNIKQYAICSTT